MRISAIDIGTNTMLMLIGEFNELTSQIHTLLDMQRIPRLGKGVDSNKNIPDESVRKAINILNDYKKISSEHGSDKIIATATSFLRDANNKSDFIEAIKKDTGIEIEILSGEDEARWSFWGGAYEQFQIKNYELQICTIDIGGGSTEISSVKIIPKYISKEILLNHPIEGISIDIGSVRINERFLNIHPPSFENIVKAGQFINEHLDKINFQIKGSKLIGIAGTNTTIAAIMLGLREFNKEKIEGIVLSFVDVQKILNRLIAMPIEELYSLGDFMEGRADIIVPGALILKCFMQKFHFDKITVSTKGLRYGILLRELM